jgi:hypothetical protein
MMMIIGKRHKSLPQTILFGNAQKLALANLIVFAYIWQTLLPIMLLYQ